MQQSPVGETASQSPPEEVLAEALKVKADVVLVTVKTCGGGLAPP
jgi:hypothetical protein